MGNKKKVKNSYPFPYKAYFMLSPSVSFGFLKICESLQTVKNTCENNPNVKFESDIDLSFNGKKIFIYHSEDNYHDFDSIGDCFIENEKLRIKCNRRNYHSPQRVWDEYSKKIYEYFDYLNYPHTWEFFMEVMREYLYSLPDVKECTQFKPSLMFNIANIICEKFDDIYFLDMSAGWGDRLIGAMACEKYKKYHGYDPLKSLKVVHDEIIQYFKFHCDIDSSKYSICYEPFETAEISETYNVVFLSPPQFDGEFYSKDSTQSIIRYPKLEVWKQDYLIRSINNGWNCLEKKWLYDFECPRF